MHTLDFEFGRFTRGLAALGGGVIACGGDDGMLMTVRASTGQRLDTLQMESRSEVRALAAVRDGVLVAGCENGALVSLSHSGGRKLRVVDQYKPAGTSFFSIAVYGDVVVTASRDKTAAVWSAVTQKRLAVLFGHRDWVRCTALGKRFIATGSDDKSIRLYENNGSYSLVRVLEGLHTDYVRHFEFLGEDMLLSGSDDKSLAFTSLSAARSMARVDFGYRILSVAILSDGRLACVGWKAGSTLLSLPAPVSGEV